jgi:redox-sensing transcriptional repressor
MTAVSNKIIDRLTLYHCILKYTVKGQEFISSSEIADLLNLDASSVRKDIALCGVLGHKKNGYITAELQSAIEKKLGFSERKEVFIIGAGNLGTALVNYADFKDYGIDILALFDNDVDKIGQEVNGKRVLALCKLEDLVGRISVKNVILSVPPQVAQEVADYAVKCGVQFIWNFTPTVLSVPKSVTVYYENIVSSFMQMRNGN